MTKTSQAPPIDRKWLIFAALGTGVFLASFNIGIANVILPTLVMEFNVDFALVQWVVLSFTLTQTAISPAVGRLGDMLGHKPIFLWGTIAFALGSILAGLAPNIALLLAFRVVQAAGGAFAIALSMGIVTETFPKSERGKALGLFSAAVSAGGVAGPLLGGVLLDLLSWRWTFFVGFPLSCISLALAWLYLPKDRPRCKERFDWTGATTFSAGLLALMLFLTVGESRGYGSPPMIGLFAFALFTLALFIHTERRVKEPLLDLTIFRSPRFSLSLSTRLISFIVFGGVSLIFPFYLTNLLTLEPSLVGLLLAITSLFFGLASPIAGALSDRFSFHIIAGAGLVMLGFGCFTVSTLNADTSILGFILRVTPLGLGMGLFQSPNNSAVMGAVPRERLGVASGLNTIGRTLGRTSGVAALGALWAVRVSHHGGPEFTGSVTQAAAAAQVAGLRDVSYTALAIVLLGLALSVWGFLKDKAPAQTRHRSP